MPNRPDRLVRRQDFAHGARPPSTGIPMQVFVFDLLQYAEHLDHLRVNGTLSNSMVKKFFKSEVAVRTYREYFDAWVELERMGFDGVAFNEHHVTPYGLMNSPNLLT